MAGFRELGIVGTVAVTVLLWCIFDSVKPVFGHLGIVALIPLLVFYGGGWLTLEEFTSMPWNVLILIGGGLALGAAVQASTLLTLIANAIRDAIADQGSWTLFVAFNCFMAVIANFISSTVAAIIVLPIVAHVGVSTGHAETLVIGSAMMCSGAMGLPVSSFPNANSAATCDSKGDFFLKSSHFVRFGFTVGGIILVLLCTLGYAELLLMETLFWAKSS